jgi:hemoglobin
MPFAIGPRERDQWLLCMRQALAEQVADERLRAAVDNAFTGLADHMINQ